MSQRTTTACRVTTVPAASRRTTYTPAAGRSNHVRYITKEERVGGRPVNFLRLLRTPRCLQLRRLSLAALELQTDSLDVLQCLERLEELDLSYASFKPVGEAGRRLASLLARPSCRLRRLYARQALLTDPDICALAKGLAQVRAGSGGEVVEGWVRQRFPRE